MVYGGSAAWKLILEWTTLHCDDRWMTEVLLVLGTIAENDPLRQYGAFYNLQAVGDFK